MKNELQTNKLYQDIIEQIKTIDTTDIEERPEDFVVKTKLIDKQKTYFWIRLFLKQELKDIKIGDDFNIKYILNGETIDTKFICFGKSNLSKNYDSTITEYDPDDDKKILCLMIDEEIIRTSPNIPFIRTLFKTSIYYEYQLIRRSDLVFTNLRTGENIEYIDCNF